MRQDQEEEKILPDEAFIIAVKYWISELQQQISGLAEGDKHQRSQDGLRDAQMQAAAQRIMYL